MTDYAEDRNLHKGRIAFYGMAFHETSPQSNRWQPESNEQRGSQVVAANSVTRAVPGARLS